MKLSVKDGLYFSGLLLVAFIMLDLIFFQNTKRICYFENMSADQWHASYFLFDGNMDRMLHLKALSTELKIRIQTDKGHISLEVKDTRGNMIFKKSDIQTSEFDIPISGDVSIHLCATQHKGSFDFEAE